MIGIVIVSHADLALQFVVAIEHVVGKQKNLEYVCIHPKDDMEKKRKEIIKAIKMADTGSGVIVATDMFGGTPSNLAISNLVDGKIEVIAGVNLPMLVKMISDRKKVKLDKLVKLSQEAGRKYINVASAFFEEKNIFKLSPKQLNKDILYLSSENPFSLKTVKNYINHIANKYDTIKKNKKDIRSLVKRLGATQLMNRRFFTLSKSEKRIVSLISVISADPKVLIIDDLDIHLTTEELKVLRSVLNKKANYDGVTIIAGCRFAYNFPKYASVNITLDSGRIVGSGQCTCG